MERPLEIRKSTTSRRLQSGYTNRSSEAQQETTAIGSHGVVGKAQALYVRVRWLTNQSQSPRSLSIHINRLERWIV